MAEPPVEEPRELDTAGGADRTEAGALKERSCAGSDVDRASGGVVSPADVYRETMASIRHYSLLRFTLMPIFFALTGVLLKVDVESSRPVSDLLVIAAGGYVSLLFLVFELALTTNLSRLWKAAQKLAHRYPVAFAHRRRLLIWPVAALVPLLYIGALLLWCARWYCGNWIFWD